VSKQRPGKTPSSGRVEERRQQPRDAVAASDWETIALRRVARRVRVVEDAASGWEEAALRNLKRRLKDRGPS
jgi:hypothetical protein